MNRLKIIIKWSCLLASYVFVNPTSSVQNRNYFIKMAELAPPSLVRGMTKLNRTLFDKTIVVPSLVVKTNAVVPLTDIFKNYLLKFRALKSIRPLVEEGVVTDKREVLLNPKKVCTFIDIDQQDQERLEQFEVTESSFKMCTLHLTYDNWTADDIFKAVLPEGVESATSYSLIGHIIHLNLREHLLDYKHLIGEVLLDKIKPARTVVNKVDNIENPFRVLNMEILAGEPDFITEVKEHHIKFKFDFSTVYWNPRLSMEHKRIVDKLEPKNILYDVFAGVGPFSIPAAKKHCTVLANDLNPESFKWLKYNAKINKVEDNVRAFNKDGAAFIREDVKQHILQEGGKGESHVVMNLPALAVTFLKEFRNFFTLEELATVKNLPLIHVYCFIKGEGDTKEMAKDLVEKELTYSISESLDDIFFVRNVAPSKDMMRVSFRLTGNIILGRKRMLECEDTEKTLKKLK